MLPFSRSIFARHWSGLRLPFAWLHSWQDGARFSISLLPPLALGSMWSISK